MPRLAHAGVDVALVDGHVDGEGIGHLRRRLRRDDEAAERLAAVAGAVVGRCGQRRQVAGELPAQVALGGLEGLAGAVDAEVPRQRHFHPCVLVGRHRIDDGQVFVQPVHFGDRIGGERAQPLEVDVVVALGLDARHDFVVVGGLGLQHVRDRHQADVEALLHLLQLPLHGLFGRHHRLQSRLAAQDVEIGRGDPRDQALSGRFEVPVGLLGARLRAAVVEPARQVQHRLVDASAPAAPFHFTVQKGTPEIAAALVEVRAVRGHRGPRGAGIGADPRHQAGAGQGHALLPRLMQGARAGEHRIVVHRLGVDIAQIGAAGACRSHHESRAEERLHAGAAPGRQTPARQRFLDNTMHRAVLRVAKTRRSRRRRCGSLTNAARQSRECYFSEHLAAPARRPASLPHPLPAICSRC